MYKLTDFQNAKIHLNSLQDEILPSGKHPCFQGAWYYKAVSARDHWLGIEAIVTLPEWIPDENRTEQVEIEGILHSRHLDTPSVYAGGSSDFETDIGFGFFHGKFNGVITPGKITFRPFWRTIWLEDGVQKNVYSGVKIDETEHYFYPGDTVFLQLICLEENHLTLRLKLIKETKLLPYSELRKIGNQPEELIVEHIKAPGNGIRSSEYKRVNAIDQYHNEGKPTQDTLAKVVLGSWDDVFLFKEIDGELLKVPFTKERYTKMTCPVKEAFFVESTPTGETITIDPSKAIKKVTSK